MLLVVHISTLFSKQATAEQKHEEEREAGKSTVKMTEKKNY